MDFNDFCESENELNKKAEEDRFYKFNKNLQKNAQKMQINGQNLNSFDNFSNNCNQNENVNKQNFDKKELTKKIEKYKNMNQSELLNELLKESGKQKQNGNLDDKKLQDIKNSLSGVLTEEQQSRLDDLIKMLR